MRLSKFFFQLIFALTLVTFVLSGDEIIEAVDEEEQPENLSGIHLDVLQKNKAKVLQLRAKKL
jgi:hypothetical protein